MKESQPTFFPEQKMISSTLLSGGSEGLFQAGRENFSKLTALNFGYSIAKILMVFLLSLLVVTMANAATKTASVTGNWSAPATWGNSPAPLAGDDVIINSEITVTLDVNTPVLNSVTINQMTKAGTNGITVGTFTLNTGSISITGGNNNRFSTISLSTGIINCTGSFTFAGTAAQARLIYTGTGVLNIGGNFGNGGTLTTVAGSVINFNGSSAQTAGIYTTYNVLKSNNPAGVTLLGASTITTLTIGDVTGNSVFNDGGYVISLGGGSVLNLISGTYNLGSATVGTDWPNWTSANISAGTTVGYVSAVAQTVSPTPTYSNLTLSGAGDKTIGNNITVNGNFSSSGGTLTIPANRTFTLGGNFSGSSLFVDPIRLTLNGTVDQTITNTGGSTFDRFIINKTGGSAILGSNITTADYTLTTGTFDASFYLLTVTTPPTLTAGILRVGATTWAANYSFTPTPPAGFTIEYYNANPTINGAITYQNLQFSGTGTAGASADLTIQGNLTNTAGGTLNFGTKNVTLSGNVNATYSIAGFTTTGTVSTTKTRGTATFAGAINGGALTIIGNGGTLNLGVGLTHTFAGAWTRTNGTLNGGSSTLKIGGSVSGTGGAFTAGTGTVEWNASGNQTIAGVAYNNLTLSGTGAKTFGAITTVSGALVITSGVSANLGAITTHTANTMSLNGANVIDGTWGSTSSIAVFRNNTWFAATTGHIKIGLTNPSNGTWTGVTSTNWGTGTNWFGGSAPGSGVDVVIPNFVTSPVISGYADCKNIDVHTGATLTIASGGSLKIAGTQTLNGALSVQRNLPSGNWHLISSPVSGDNTSSFCARNSVPGGPSDYDLAPYIESSDSWTFGTTPPGFAMLPGSGYSVSLIGAGSVSFTGGVMNTGAIPVGITKTTILGVDNGWNCVGNPYTSSIDAAVFLVANTSQIDNVYSFIYLWDQGMNDYTQVNTGAISVGQGFFVNSRNASGSVSFTSGQQIHAADAFKSEVIPLPTIKLTVTSNDLYNETTINFGEMMTLGLDPGFDGGKLKGNPDIALYTRLLKDNGVDFAIQALPGTGLESYRIPVGLDLPDGGNVSFTTKNLNLPMGAKVVLEDTKTNTFTELTSNNDRYNTTVEAGKGGIGRFYLNTGNIISGLPEIFNKEFSLYIKNRMIYINGSFTPETEFSLYSMDGKKLMNRMAEGLQENVLDASGLTRGVYLLKISSKGKIQTEKLVLAN